MIGPGWETGRGNSRRIGDNLTMTDNSAALMEALANGMEAAMLAAGKEAVGFVKEKMDSGYTDAYPNRDASGKKTGGTHTNMRASSFMYNTTSFNTSAEDGAYVVEVGTEAEYAMFVHEGTRFMRPRPFLRDALEQNWNRIQEVWAATLKQNM